MTTLPRAPRQSSGRRTFLTHLVLLVAIGLPLLWIPWRTPLNVYDEGLALVGALRVAGGETPIRDFWTLYAPGQFYTLAALFRFFGESVAVTRLFDSLIRLLLALVIWLVARRLLPHNRALAVGVAALLVVVGGWFYSYVMYPALLYLFGAVLAFAHFVGNRRPAMLWLAGALGGLVAVYRLDVGVYAGLGLAVGCLLLVLTEPATVPGAGARVAKFARRLLPCAAGALLVAGPVYLWLAAAAGPALLWESLVDFPRTTFRTVRRLPLPPLLPLYDPTDAFRAPLRLNQTYGEWLRFYLPLLLYLLTGWALVRDLRGRRNPESAKVTAPSPAGETQQIVVAGMLLALGLLLVNQSLSRYDAIHALPTNLFALLLAAWLVHRWWPHAGRVRAAAGLLAAAAILLYVVAPLTVMADWLDNYPPWRCYSDLPRASCVPIAPDQVMAVAYVDATVPPDAPVLVANHRHDMTIINDVSFYFLVDRPAPTRYHELHPGVVTTQAVQEEMVAELGPAPGDVTGDVTGDVAGDVTETVEWVVVVEMPDSKEPNGSAVSSGVTLLDETLAQAYRRDQQIGRYTIRRLAR